MYVKNYIQIYLWKVLSLLTGFLSLVLVIPEISNNQELYGIYAFTISLSLYFTYADIGFISSGQKFASEEYAKNEHLEENNILGFTTAVMFCMFIPMTIIFLFFSYFPSLVFKDLSLQSSSVASGLFMILGTLIPLQVILQRTLLMILSIRLLDYISIRIDIVFNFIKILSIFYFFTEDRYMIVEYFLFSTLVTILGSLIGFFYVRYRVNFKLWMLIKAVKISKVYYLKTKGLAFASAAITIGFTLFYELDLIIVGFLFGAKEVAIFAIAFTFISFFRRLWSIIYSPISVRLNHFVGLNSKEDIVELLNSVIYYTFPLCIITSVALLLSTDEIIVSWVGLNYLESILILQILMISFLPAFLTNPGFHFFISHERKDYLYALAFTLPIIFYSFILFFYEILGILSFAYGKVIVTTVELIICWIGLRNIMFPSRVIGKWLLPCIIWISFSFLLLPLYFDYFNYSEAKNSLHLIQKLLMIGIYIFISYLIFFCIYKKDRNDIIKLSKLIYIRILSK